MEYKLTEYSHGAGCGCKLSPAVLSEILRTSGQEPVHEQLLVGNDTSDDAAVVDLDGKTAIVSTTDFFMPIVDDAYDFGAIAATNAISDVYAMGAEPIVAIAILGWPINKIPANVASRVLQGARSVCTNAGIPMAGGHSIDTPEPIFGLAVTGKVPIEHIKKNKNGRPGDLLYLTKPLGVGTVTTAKKKNLAEQHDLDQAKKSMLTLNTLGREMASMPYVHAMTDVTGFGLGGHLLEMCDAGGISARIYKDRVPVFEFADKYIELDCIPGGTYRNWDTYGHRISLADTAFKHILADPQTSGGLLISVDPGRQQEFETFLSTRSFHLQPIGQLRERSDGATIVIL